MLPPGDTASVQLNGKLRLPANYFKLLMPVNQQAEKRVSVPTGVSDPDYQGFLLCSRDKEEHFPEPLRTTVSCSKSQWKATGI